MAALVVDSGSGMLAMLVFLVMILHALCSLRPSACLSFQASWPGMFQMDSGVLIVDSGSGMSQAGFADISPHPVFLSIVAWPLMLRLLADMDQKDRCSGLFMAGIVGYGALRAVFPSLVGKPRVLGTVAGIHQKDSYALFLGKAGIACDNAPRAVFSPLLGKPNDAQHHGRYGQE